MTRARERACWAAGLALAAAAAAGGTWLATAPRLRIPAGARLVGNANTGVYHTLDCPHAPRIRWGHRLYLRSAAEAAQAGLRPCRICRPDAKKTP